MRTDLLARVDGLRSRRGAPFSCWRPSCGPSARRAPSRGDCAVVTADGLLDGFVGGVCAESTVRIESLRLLAAGESELLRITPDAGEVPAQDGVRTVGNPCLSGGTLEIFLEAMIPPVLVAVFGESPVARAIARVGAAVDWDVRVGLEPLTADTSAVVVASHGRDEIPVLRAALDADVDYIALVASRRRAAGVLDELGATDGERSRIHAPAGLDIGARSPGEIALSVCAGIVAARPRVARPAVGPPPNPTVAVDPICGMEVLVGDGTLQAGGRVLLRPRLPDGLAARGG